ncbi:MAG: 5'-3' exonuclease, partial [Lachnospiraceae bacterium]|nr:5'-3' exonuclease [Lachnospiraceae bacterium]
MRTTRKFLIIDGSSMLSTSYYGNLPKSVLYAKTDEEKEKHYPEILRTSKGAYTNALFTMLKTLISLHKKVTPDYVAVAFDVSRDTFRRTQLGAESYKANRK